MGSPSKRCVCRAEFSISLQAFGAHGVDGIRHPEAANGRLLDGRTWDAIPRVVRANAARTELALVKAGTASTRKWVAGARGGQGGLNLIALSFRKEWYPENSLRPEVCLAALLLVAPFSVAWGQRVPPLPPADIGTEAGSASDPGSDHSVDCVGVRDLKFSPGKTETSVSDTITRDDTQGDCYTFVARKGQTFDARLVNDSTPNIAIVVFRHGYGLRKHDDFQYMDGPVLPGTGRDDAAKHLHEVLPVSGRYLIMMGPAYGGAAGYTLRVQIR